MPELPEVETTLRGILPHLAHQVVSDVIIRHPRLRWPIPADLKHQLCKQTLLSITRRAKYLLFTFKTGTMILHLGMSGRVRILDKNAPPQKHDHVDIQFSNGKILRFTDPRRFGALLFTKEDPNKHPLLTNIGPEPLSDAFTGNYLFQSSRGRKTTVKTFIMNSAIVAGVGNIYATEALFLAHLRPQTSAGKIPKPDYQHLAHAIKKILTKAIKKGGTTLKDFSNHDGKPGYFRLELNVYGQGGKPCPVCGSKLTATRIGQRGTVYCKQCQH